MTGEALRRYAQLHGVVAALKLLADAVNAPQSPEPSK